MGILQAIETAREKWGGRWGLNPRPQESQSCAVMLIIMHLSFFSVAIIVCKLRLCSKAYVFNSGYWHTYFNSIIVGGTF